MIGAVLACFVTGGAIAQDKPADQMEILREKARAAQGLAFSPGAFARQQPLGPHCC
jgi:hypothetical protein